MSLTDLEIIYKAKGYFKTRYRHSITIETFNDLFHDAMETYINKSKIENIQFPKSYFGWLLKSKVANFKKNRKNKATEYVDTYPEISVEPPNHISPTFIKEVNNIIQQLPKQQKLMAQEYIINESPIYEIAEEHNMKYMTTKANVRHMLTAVKKKLKSHNEND